MLSSSTGKFTLNNFYDPAIQVWDNVTYTDAMTNQPITLPTGKVVNINFQADWDNWETWQVSSISSEQFFSIHNSTPQIINKSTQHNNSATNIWSDLLQPQTKLDIDFQIADPTQRTTSRSSNYQWF